MLFYIYEHLQSYNLPGLGMFQYITFRSGMAIILSLLIATVFGKRLIGILQKKQIGEIVRYLGLEGQYQKKGYPSIGCVLIFISILNPVLLFDTHDILYIIWLKIT